MNNDKEKFGGNSQKAIYALYLLQKEKKKRTIEDLSVKLWEIYPKECCMKGYPNYPIGANIIKYLTILLRNNFMRGSVANYTITDKGKNWVEKILKEGKMQKKASEKDASRSREATKEIERIKKSKVYTYFKKEKNPEFIEADMFDFLGVSVRTQHNRNKNFKSKVKFIEEEVIEHFEKNKEEKEDFERMNKMWLILKEKFGDVLK